MNISVTLLAQVVVFILLVWFTMKYVWPPIAKVLDERADKIAEGLAAAERGKSDFEKAERKVAETLAEGRKEVAAMIASADKRAATIAEAAKKDAEAQASKILAQAREDIEQELNRAREELREQVSKLAVLGAEKILRREIKAKNHAELLTALKREL